GLGVGAGIRGLLNLTAAGQAYSFIYDGKGNVTALIDNSQTSVAAYAYEPFGVSAASSGSFDQPFRFSTKSYDAKTGMSDFGYRYYSPALGRWLSRDPIKDAELTAW